MPTAYTGVPTATQSPSPAPGPDVAPIFNLVADGDPRNAASLEQMGKVSADFLAWLMSPRATMPASPTTLDAGYLVAIRRYRNAILKTRDFIDHRGFGNMGRITRWQEDWTDKAFSVQTGTIAADTAWAKRWLVTQTLGGGSPSAKILTVLGGGPYPSGPGSPVYVDGTLVLDSGNITAGPDGLQLVEAAGGTQFNDDSDLVFQTEMLAAPGGTPISNNAETSFGISAGLSGATGALQSTTPYAAAVGWFTGQAHRQLYLYNPSVGGSPVLTSLGSAGDSATRWRIEIQGLNTSDDGQRRVLVYADGAIIANVVYNMTIPSAPPCLTPFFRLLSGTDTNARFGVTDYAAVRFAGDIAY